MPHLNKQHKEFSSKGLHIFSLYRQLHSLKQVEKIAKKMKVKWPIALDGHWNSRYQSPQIPMVWLIGTDGKFKYIGDGTGYDDILAKELAKVKYPGLGLSKVEDSLKPAADAFVAGQMAKSYKLAEAVYDADEVTDDAEDQAEAIMERITGTCNNFVNSAEVAITERNYALARTALNILTTRYKGVEEAEEAPAMAEKLIKKKDEVDKEIKARRALVALMMDQDVTFQNVDITDVKAYNVWRTSVVDGCEKLAAAHKDTAAAQTATDSAVWFRAEIVAANKAAAVKPDDGKKPPDKDDTTDKPDKDDKTNK